MKILDFIVVKQTMQRESDCGKIIRQVETGREYSSAVDVIPCRYTYEETEKLIENKNE